MHRLIPSSLNLPLNTMAPRAIAFVVAQFLFSAISFSAHTAELQIKDLADIDFGEAPATIGTLRSNTSFCVAMQPRGRYSLVGFGNGAGGTFSLIDSGNGIHTLDYRVEVSDRGRRRGQPLLAGIPLSGLRASRFRNNGRCNPRGAIAVIIDGNDIQNARPGQYKGTLMLTVVPE